MSLDETSAVMTRTEAAELLQVDPRLISRGISEGKIPHLRLGRRVLILREPLTLMLKGQGGEQIDI